METYRSRRSTRPRRAQHTAVRPPRSKRRGGQLASGALAVLLGAAAFLTVPASAPTASAASTRTAVAAGSAPLGSTSYAAPSNAVYVAPWGSDSASGSTGSPVRTITKAIAVAPTGGTVVLRAGQYNETVQIYKQVTIQNYPGEVAWLDGTTPVSGWVSDGSAWRHDGWTVRFDHSPTYVKGAPDYTGDWRFVDQTLAPMASHPDQMWIGNTRLQQVRSRGDVKAGTFYLDEATSKLYVGSNPNGQQVSASNLQYAINARVAGVTLRGFGVRRYAPSVWQVAAVTLERGTATVENMIVSETATTGLSAQSSNIKINRVTSEANGLLGIHGRYADNLVMTNVLVSKNNSENFHVGPVAGGVKLGATRGVTVRDSRFADNAGHGFWEDMSVYDSVFSGNDFLRNDGTGLFLEISAKAIVGDSLIMGNKLEGLKINNTPNVKVWNNTIVNNARPVWLAQDLRRNTNRSDPAVDPRQPFPDSTMPWQLDNITMSNNVIGNPSYAANTLLCVEDYSYTESAEQMHISVNGNVYNRPNTSSPAWMTIWSRGSAGAYVFNGIDKMRSTAGQETRGREYNGASVVGSNGELSASVTDVAGQIALPLPSDVASAIGRSSGSTTIGAWGTGGASTPPPATTPPPVTTPPVQPAPSAGETAQDSFGRTVSGGLGTADRGGAWSADHADRFAVGGGVAKMSLRAGDGFRALLPNVSTSTADSSMYFALDRPVTGDGHFVSLIGRNVSGADYRVKVRLNADGKVDLWLIRTVNGIETVLASRAAAISAGAGATIGLRIQATGTSPTAVKAKVWNAGSGEPTSWALSASDSTAALQKAGSVGFYGFASARTTSGPVTVFVDEFQTKKG